PLGAGNELTGAQQKQLMVAVVLEVLLRRSGRREPGQYLPAQAVLFQREPLQGGPYDTQRSLQFGQPVQHLALRIAIQLTLAGRTRQAGEDEAVWRVVVVVPHIGMAVSAEPSVTSFALAFPVRGLGPDGLADHQGNAGGVDQLSG